MKYRQAKPGDKSVIPFEGVRHVACCECGFVHRYVYAVEPHPTRKGKGVIVQYAYADNRATAQIRRKLARDGDIGVLPKSNVYVIMPRINARQRRRRVNARFDPC